MGEKGELTDLTKTIQTALEKDGQLCSVKAEMRSLIFGAGDNKKKKESSLYLSNKDVQSALKNDEEKITLMLVKELLEFYEMESTNEVFSAESNLRTQTPDSTRAALATKTKMNASLKTPLLLQIVQRSIGNGQLSKGISDTPASTSTKGSSSSSLNSNQNTKNQPTKKTAGTTPSTTTSSSIGGYSSTSTKFDTHKVGSSASNHNLNNNSSKIDDYEIEESMGGFEDLSEEEDYYSNREGKGKGKKAGNNYSQKKDSKKNPMFSSMDETLGASQSHGQDQSVESLDLEQDYDYYEEIS